ncbi:DNA-binding Lrp family transcriptional regulator [Rhodococcus sp. 27YEA15]
MISKIDDLDRQIAHILTLDGRLPFVDVAGVLEVSEQTVGRRYGRLVKDGSVKPTAVLDPYVAGNLDQWILRISPKSGSSATLAKELARHRDISWVFVSVEEIICLFDARAEADWEAVLTERLPRTSLVSSVSALHVIRGFPLARAWPDFGALFDERQSSFLHSVVRRPGRARRSSARRDHIDSVDRAILDALAADPRASYVELADVTGLSRSRIGSRLDDLVAAQALQFSLECSARRFGFRISASVFARVPPRLVESAGTALGGVPSGELRQLHHGKLEYVCQCPLSEHGRVLRFLHHGTRGDRRSRRRRNRDDHQTVQVRPVRCGNDIIRYR